MNTHIKMKAETYQKVWQHLLPPHDNREHAAFLFATVVCKEGNRILNVEEIRLISNGDFMVQRSDFIELTDKVRISIIKKAHITGYSLIELHSHPYPSECAAAFSKADMNGFAETVPNMLWRLPSRPYTAIVAAPYGFDALTWTSAEKGPEPINGIILENKTLKPTNYTLGGVKYGQRTKKIF